MKRSMRPCPRLATISVVVLALASATTLASAWLPAAFDCHLGLPNAAEQIAHDGFTAWTQLTTDRWKDSVEVQWLDGQPMELLPPKPIFTIKDRFGPDTATPAWSSAWLTIRPVRPPATWTNGAFGMSSALTELRTGWPWRAFACSFDEPIHDPTRTPPAIYPTHDAIAIDCFVVRQPGSLVFEPRALPLRPIWAGIAGNMLVYTAMWLAILIAPGVVRRRWRARHGRCVACGYDLRGQSAPGCPECGQGFTVAK